MPAPGKSSQAPHGTQSTRIRLAFWGLLALTALARLPGINRPLLGNFSTKSVVYAMIARNWVEGRAGLFYPTLDCLVGGKRSLHMIELPVSAYLSGGLWRLFGGSLDVWGRATAVAFSVGSVAWLFVFVRRRHGVAAAFGAATALSLSPISIVYGQNFMLEASLVFLTVATLDGFDRWLEGARLPWLLASAVCFGLLLLTKIYMVVLLLPLAATALRADRPAPEDSAAGRKLGGARSVGAPLAAAALAVVPAILWCVHVMRTAAPDRPLADRVYWSLQGSADSHRPPDPLLADPDFYRQMLDDLTGVTLTPIGFGLLLAGFLNRRWRRYGPWLLAMAILVALLPRKFYAMNYYGMVLLPPLCILVGLGCQVVWQGVRPGRKATAGLLLAAAALSLRYAARPAFVTPHDDRAVVAAGRAIQQRTAEGEPVVTMHGACIDLLYYCNRPGWNLEPDVPDPHAVLDAHRRQGARYLVVAGAQASTERPGWLDSDSLVVVGDGFGIYALDRRPGGRAR